MLPGVVETTCSQGIKIGRYHPLYSGSHLPAPLRFDHKHVHTCILHSSILVHFGRYVYLPISALLWTLQFPIRPANPQSRDFDSCNLLQV
jgi:hypothetical protein